MIFSKRPLDLAENAVETMMRKFKAADLPPKGHFHYHQGIFLSGVYQTYLLNHNEAYFDYIKNWADSLIDKDGHISGRHLTDLDDMQAGILLFPLLDRTGDHRYQVALDELAADVTKIGRNSVDGLWHKAGTPNQMWLDGLYMGGPEFAEYAERFNKPELMDTILKQPLIMAAHMKDSKTGLYYHAWDESKKADWADPQTGLSPEFWGRSIGWVPLAVLNDLDFADPQHPDYQKLVEMTRDLLIAVCNFQSEDGRWYQVVDKGRNPGNWLENSCSSLFATALYKAVRKEILPDSYLEAANRAYEGVVRSLTWQGDDIQIGHVCVGTGVGNYQMYISRPTSTNDLHGVGAFLLMCAEAQRSL